MYALPAIREAFPHLTRADQQLRLMVLEALPKEQLVRRLGVALAKATRQVNTLQLRVEPTLTAELNAQQVAFFQRVMQCLE